MKFTSHVPKEARKEIIEMLEKYIEDTDFYSNRPMVKFAGKKY